MVFHMLLLVFQEAVDLPFHMASLFDEEGECSFHVLPESVS